MVRTARQTPKNLRVRVAPGLADVDAKQWDRLAGEDNPFVEHAFLRLLETSGSVGANTGWVPAHVLVTSADELIAAAPAYLKDHSLGEYVFDWAWAEAAQRAGISYYPKLVVAVPFTPATGPRLLVRPGVDATRIRRILVEGLLSVTRELGASGLHVLLPTEDEAELLEAGGLCRRLTHQFHWWGSRRYQTFADFLGALRAPVRKQIRRERRRIIEQGVEVELHKGNALDDAAWQQLYRLYLATGRRKWGEPYLTRSFFTDARQTIGHRAVVVLARRHAQIIAASLSFEKGRHLYGRYWGAFEWVEGLHFELCYYRLIEYAIDTGKTLFEAGAQGEHKLKRGLLPVGVHSCHWIMHAGLRQAVASHVRKERAANLHLIAALGQHSPFRAGAGPVWSLPRSS